MQTGSRNRLLSFLVAFMALAAVLGPSVVGTARADRDACASQKAAVDADNQAIAEHNSRAAPGGSAPAYIADPYNREANQLDAKGRADVEKLRACEAANKRLQANGPPVRPLPAQVRNGLEQARQNTPPGWRAPDPLPTNPRNQNVVVPADSPARPAYDALRRATPQRDYPDVPLQGLARPSVGDFNAAAPGQLIGTRSDGSAAVSPDHIVPLAEIVQLPRFMELTPENMWRVVNAPLNLQWLDPRVNRLKGSKDMSKRLTFGFDEEWHSGQEQLQKAKRQELIDIIAQLADSQSD